MMEKVRRFLTERIAVALLVSLFVFTVAALIGYRNLYSGQYDGWVVFPLMQLAYNVWLFVALSIVTAFFVIRWIGRRAFQASNRTGWLAKSVVGFLVLLSVGGCLTYAVVSWIYVGWTTGEVRSVRAGGYVYVSTAATWVGTDVTHTRLILMRCDFTGIVCEYLSSLGVSPRSLLYSTISEDRHQLIYHRPSDSVQLWDSEQLRFRVADVSRRDVEPITLPQLDAITAANVNRIETVAVLELPAVGHLAFSPDGTHLAAGIADLETGYQRPVNDGNFKTPGIMLFPTSALHNPTLLAGDSDYWWNGRDPKVAFSGESRYVTISGDNPFVNVWDVQSGESVVNFQTPIAYSSKVFAVNPQTGEVAVAGTEDANVYQLPAMTEVTVYDAPNINLHGEYQGAAYSPDGTKFAVVGQSLVVWDVTEPRRPRVLDRLYNLDGIVTTSQGLQSLVDVTFSPDSETVAAVRNQIVLYDIESRERTAVLGDEDTMVSKIAFHPNGDLIASNHWQVQQANRLPEVYMWSLTEDAPIATLTGHEMHVHSVAFHPDGHLLASASADGTVRLWGVPTDD